VAIRNMSPSYESIEVWDVKEGKLIYQFGGKDSSFSSDSKMIAVSVTGLWKNQIFIYDLLDGNAVFSTEQFFSDGMPPKVVFSPDGKYLAIMPEYGYPQIWGIP